MSDALTAKLRALSDPRACQDNEFGASVACAEALAEIEALRGEVELHEIHWTEARDERNKIRAWLCDKGLDAEYGETCDVPGCPKVWEEENAALRAEVDRLHTQRGEEAQTLIDFCATLGIAEEDVSWDALRARVAALEAVVLAAREYRALHIRVEASDSMTGADLVQLGTDAIRVESALDAALAALEVPRG